MRTCPLCNWEVSQGVCHNRWCKYRGPGLNLQEKKARLERYADERTSGGNAYGHYEE